MFQRCSLPLAVEIVFRTQFIDEVSQQSFNPFVVGCVSREGEGHGIGHSR